MSSFHKRPAFERFIVVHNGAEQVSYSLKLDSRGPREQTAYSMAAFVASRFNGEIWGSYDDEESPSGRVMVPVKSYRSER